MPIRHGAARALRRHHFVVVCLAFASLLGCASSPARTQCARDSDCATDLICVAGFCRRQCGDDRDCETGLRCNTRNICVEPQLPDPCDYASDCDPPLVCGPSRVCRAQCREDYDCTVLDPGLRCVTTASPPTCEPVAGDGGASQDAGS